MRQICIHGHFYQPDRIDPWTGRVPRQRSAAPYHDWNERVNVECYAPNAAARPPGPDGSVARAVSNYERISFDFGPTLLAWLELNATDTYRAVLDADRAGRDRFGGHGPAIAQGWAHSILPLDSERDRRTQVAWGIHDFERRFGRRPEGLWLPETAVDVPTLETLAGFGMRFTVLAQHQAETADPRRPSLCHLPSGRSIALFLYNGTISHDAAFGTMLDDGDEFAARLLAVPSDDDAGLTHIATDGETYGHHHESGELALARCLESLDGNPTARLTVYGEHLDRFPPTGKARLLANTSWSCDHGVERWRADCGCATGAHPNWNQRWRAPLREAMEWLRDRIAEPFEERLAGLIGDPWAARDDYVSVVLDHSGAETDRFLAEHRTTNLPPADRTRALGLFEMQRFELLMFSSCGWFFDDLTELSTVQNIRCAARAIELCREHTGTDLEPGYLDILGRATSNNDRAGSGADVYRGLTRPRT